jgi:hypothetical protein
VYDAKERDVEMRNWKVDGKEIEKPKSFLALGPKGEMLPKKHELEPVGEVKTFDKVPPISADEKVYSMKDDVQKVVDYTNNLIAQMSYPPSLMFVSKKLYKFLRKNNALGLIQHEGNVIRIIPVKGKFGSWLHRVKMQVKYWRSKV